MADAYWDHPSRREVKRLIDLGDVDAILDELQDRTTEWDDARRALDHLVTQGHADRAAERDDLKAEVERLRADLEQSRGEVKRLRAALGRESRRVSTLAPPTSGAPDSVVRTWARERGIPHNARGRVEPEVRSAYEAACRDEQEEDGRD